MKKRLLFLFVFSLIIISLSFVISQEGVPGGAGGPGGKIAEDVGGKLGGIDPATGTPKKIIDLKEQADEFLNPREKGSQNSSFLRREWGTIFAKNKVIGPIFSATDKFFSFFNPLWKFSFGIEFSWSLSFFFHMFLWLAIVAFVAIALYFGELMSLLFSIVTGSIVASITGSQGLIKSFVGLMEIVLVNMWAFTLGIIIIFFIIYLDYEIFKSFKKEAKKEKLKRAKKSTEALGEVAEETLKDIGSEPEDLL